MEDFKRFMAQYGGMIIGILVAIILLCTKLYMLIVGIVLIVICGFVGHYIQHNKDRVKENLKNFIDKL